VVVEERQGQGFDAGELTATSAEKNQPGRRFGSAGPVELDSGLFVAWRPAPPSWSTNDGPLYRRVILLPPMAPASTRVTTAKRRMLYQGMPVFGNSSRSVVEVVDDGLVVDVVAGAVVDVVPCSVVVVVDVDVDAVVDVVVDDGVEGDEEVVVDAESVVDGEAVVGGEVVGGEVVGGEVVGGEVVGGEVVGVGKSSHIPFVMTFVSRVTAPFIAST
jgi:hypothetical protein